eukprot:360979-Chlamydomonas_euryale.AAC.2
MQAGCAWQGAAGLSNWCTRLHNALNSLATRETVYTCGLTLGLSYQCGSHTNARRSGRREGGS